jgi:hypothetical protein
MFGEADCSHSIRLRAGSFFSMLLRIFSLALILAMAGCAGGPVEGSLAPQSAPPSRTAAPSVVSGIWEGETRVIPCPPMNTPFGRCNAVNRITLDLRQDGSTIRGHYKCAIGTLVCRDANRTTSGRIIEGSVSDGTIGLRVLLTGDLSTCIYNGDVSSASINGTYRCYQGGGLNEVGIWQVSRRGGDADAPGREGNPPDPDKP